MCCARFEKNEEIEEYSKLVVEAMPDPMCERSFFTVNSCSYPALRSQRIHMIKQSFYLMATVLVASSSLFCGNAGADLKPVAVAGKNVFDSTVRPTGAIAYIRNGSEIRLIDSNGKNDRRIWTHPNAKEPLGLFDLAWRPDGKELAFSCAHEAVYSLYHSDLYSIRPDGSGFRKITNAPAHADLGKFKKGSVTVTVRNHQYSFQQAQSSAGVFIVNIVGADEPQQVTLPPGASKTLHFKNVADLGDNVQPLVAIFGNYRWMMPGTDVQAGKNVKAPDFIISGDGYAYFGAFRPIWKRDGSAISYRDGLCMIKTIPSNPPEGEFVFNPLFSGENPTGTCVWDWGPTSELEDKIIYSENTEEEGSGIYLGKEGTEHTTINRLTLFADVKYQLAHDLRWLPDGSGFLYSATNLYADAGNIFRYDIHTKKTQQLTQLQGTFARRFCISPDGRWVVYERAKTPEDYETVDLWIIRTDGAGDRLLVKNGLGPAWSK
jgi:Tol biopolymer transport system component